jgi:hypothetical protein
MMLAVVDDDAHVLQRESGDRTGGKHLFDAFCTAGMNWLGIVPPLTSSLNSKPLPRGSGSIRR